MIKVKHPVDRCNIEQENVINNCSAEERRFHELLFTYGNIVYRYNNTAKEFNPNENDWQEWLEGLPLGIRVDMSKKGFQNCKGVLSFTRYVMEKNDIGLEEYVKIQMGEEEYNEYKNLTLKND